MVELHFLQLNMHRAQAASAFLQTAVDSVNYIALLTEPYSYKNKCAVLPASYVAIPRNELAQRPRAAILHHQSLQLVEVKHLTNADCAVGVVTGSEPFLVASAYLDINLPAVPVWLGEVVGFARAKGYKLVLGMDSNAHSPLFGGPGS